MICCPVDVCRIWCTPAVDAIVPTGVVVTAVAVEELLWSIWKQQVFKSLKTPLGPLLHLENLIIYLLDRFKAPFSTVI